MSKKNDGPQLGCTDVVMPLALSIPEDRLRRECERLYNNAHDCMIECLEPENVDYQSGVKAAMSALFFRLTAGTLVVPDLIVNLPDERHSKTKGSRI